MLRLSLTHNLGLKVVSFLIAVAIWYKVSLVSQPGVTQVFHRPLKVLNKDPRLAVSHPVEDGTVAIWITGRRIDLMRAEPMLEAAIDLKHVKSPIGEAMVSVEASFPQGLNLRLLKIEPKTVRVSVRAADGSVTPAASLPIPTPFEAARAR